MKELQKPVSSLFSNEKTGRTRNVDIPMRTLQEARLNDEESLIKITQAAKKLRRGRRHA